MQYKKKQEYPAFLKKIIEQKGKKSNNIDTGLR